MSNDFGKTWETDQELEIYRCGGKQSGIGEIRNQAEYWGDMFRWTFGHPCSVRLYDDTVLIAFYAGDKYSLNIHWVKVKL